MRQLLWSFAGALVVHLFLFLSPLAYSSRPTALEQPRPGGGITVHFVQDVPPRHHGKTLPDSTLLSGSNPETGHEESKTPSPQKIGQQSAVPQVQKPVAANQNGPPVFDGPQGLAHVEAPALAKVRGPDLKIQEGRGKGGAAPPRGEAMPLWDQNQKPLYPTLARRRGWQGSVLVEVMVVEDGSVGSLDIHTGSGHRLLDQTAVNAVRRWHFLPARKGGLAVPGQVLVPIHFRLHN